MQPKRRPILSDKKRYLQIALNSTLDEASKIIHDLPKSERIIVEAGTPLIKRYGVDGIHKIYQWYQAHLWGLYSAQQATKRAAQPGALGFIQIIIEQIQKQKASPTTKITPTNKIRPYVVADLKMMDRGETEVQIAAEAGASAAVALGAAPIESLDAFVQACWKNNVDSMIDMMNIDFPLRIIDHMKNKPDVIVLHRGVDEEKFNKEKQIPLHEIRRIKSRYNMMISVAGGDTLREVQRSIFNDADIVVAWKSFYQNTKDTANLAHEFLDEVK